LYRGEVMGDNKRRSVMLFIVVYATMFFFGFVENIKGVSFPLIKTEFGVNYESQGGLVSLTWFGYVLFCFVASMFMQHFGTKKSILMGYILICIGAVATLMAPSFWTASLTLLIVNAGFGFFEVGNNALGTTVFTRNTALMMSLMHFFYGFGAILGPKTAGLLTNTFNLSWRQVYVVVIIPLIAAGIFILLTKFSRENTQEEKREEAPKVTFIGAFRNPLVWVFSLTLGFMEVIEFGAANWGGLYLKDVYNLDPRIVGASFVSIFYVLFTLSRLFSGLVIEKIGYIKSLIIATASTIAIFLAGFALGRNGIWLLPGTGFFIAIMFPTMMAVCTKYFAEDAAAVTSAIITLSGAVNGIFQLIIGFTNQYVGEPWGYRSCLLYSAVVLIILCRLSYRIRKQGLVV
jgi:fucose permease